MKLKTMLYILLSIVSLNGYAQENNANSNAFHLKNGDVIKGHITEHDVENGTYQISENSGEKSSIQASEISKIVFIHKNTESNNSKHYKSNPHRTKSKKYLKNSEIGFSLFIMSIERKSNSWGEDNNLTHEGFSGFYSQALNDHLVTRFYIYDATVSDEDKQNVVNNSRISGMEAQVLLTTNSNHHGWKFFGGVSAFGEVWDTEREKSNDLLPSKDTHAGFGLVYGLGYNFKSVAIDFSTTIRQKTSYELPEAKTIASGGLTISHRF